MAHFADPQIRLWRDPALGAAGTELLTGVGMRRGFGRLLRDELVIAVVTAGALRFSLRDIEGTAPAGSILLVPAGEPFSVEPASEDGWSWRVFHPDLSTVAEHATELLSGPPVLGPQMASAPVTQNSAAATRLAQLHRAIEEGDANPLARQQAFVAAMAVVPQVCPRPAGWPRRAGPDSAAIRQAVACVKRRFSDPALSIADLARAAGYSQYHFMRRFAAAVGITAHDYIVQCRLHAARRMLANGVLGAEVALAAGFTDQSHLIRHFRAAHGITPGRYAELTRKRSKSLPPGVRPSAGRRWELGRARR